MTAVAVDRRVSRSAGRRYRWVLAVIVIAALSVVLAACSSGGTGLARQACGHVNKSIALFKQAEQSSTQAQANSLAEKAYVQLRDALPLAARAAAADGQWQALMTTLSETNRVGEQYLITSLKDQCAVAKEQNPLEPPGPQHTIPPPPTNISNPSGK